VVERVDDLVTIRNARIVFRNFSGKEGKYNREGDRSFCVLLDPEVASEMERIGWNVKALRAREEGDPDQPYIMVSVSFKGRPPRIVLITHKNRTDIEEEDVEILDWVDIKQCDLVFRPYNWTVRDASGVKAYLKTMFITINEDELEIEYADSLANLDQQLPARAGRTED
jgi:hypothetical protein